MESSMLKRLEATKVRLGEIDQELMDEKVTSDIRRFRELSKERAHWYDISRFDFDTSFGKDNAIHDYCIIRKETLKYLDKVYDDLTDEKSYANTFWKEATGWAFKYTAGKNTYQSSFRPWIDLIVSDTKQEEIKQNEKHLADAIQKFYAGSNYWGD